MAMRNIISDYLVQTTRNRLIFCHEHIEGLSFINVGKTLAEGLASQNLRSPMIAYIAEEILSDILSANNIDAEIGPYVALDNIGILFEPELAFNLRTVIDNASTNKAVFIHSDGFINSDRFYFQQEGDSFSIDLQGLSYIDIY